MPPPLQPNSRILVTGGAGFIGSALVAALNERGLTNILIVDLLGRDEKWKNLRPLVFRDYEEAPDFARKLQEDPARLGRFDGIFHLGACSATTEMDASYLATNNFALTRDLCHFALSQDSRFVYASSAATYGDGSSGLDDAEPALEKFRPLNAYGYSKQLFDLHARENNLLDRIVGLKYFNVFGPNEYHKGEMRSLVCKAYRQIRDTGAIKLFKSYRPEYPDGGQMRDFLYVKDAVAMTLHLADSPTASGLYNLGAGIARTWLDLAHSLFSALHLPPNIEFIEMPESLRHQYQYYTRAEIQRLRQTGYSSDITSLEDAVHDYVLNYLEPGLHLGEHPLNPSSPTP